MLARGEGQSRHWPQGQIQLAVTFTGVDHSGSFGASRKRGSRVSNAAGYSTNAVAELVFALAIEPVPPAIPACDPPERAPEAPRTGWWGA